jgi:hypothetical protein
VDPETADSLASLDIGRVPVAAREVDAAEDALAYPRGRDAAPVLRRRADGACLFLRDDCLCELHHACGSHAKPRACREFPFIFRPTPGGVFVGLSFLCPSVRGNRGKPLSDATDALTGLTGALPDTPGIREPIAFNDRLTLTWTEYVAIEGLLLELLAREDATLAQRMTACVVLLNFVDVWQKRTRDPQPGEHEPRPVPGGELEKFLEVVRRTAFADVLRVARKPAGAPRLRRVFLGMFTGLAGADLKNTGRGRSIARVFSQYLRHSSGLGAVRLQPFAQPVPYRVLGAAGFPEMESGNELLLRYVRHCVFRKDLVHGCSLLRGMNLLVLRVAVTRWYASAAGWQAGRQTPAETDWSEAVGLVETCFGCHSDLSRAFTGNPVVDEIVDSFMVRRNFPFVILGE